MQKLSSVGKFHDVPPDEQQRCAISRAREFKN
jgi:hypothetical protein